MPEYNISIEIIGDNNNNSNNKIFLVSIDRPYGTLGYIIDFTENKLIFPGDSSFDRIFFSYVKDFIVHFVNFYAGKCESNNIHEFVDIESIHVGDNIRNWYEEMQDRHVIYSIRKEEKEGIHKIRLSFNKKAK